MNASRCADVSAAAGEQLAGSAVTVENWLLLEVAGTWPRDVTAVTEAGEPGAAAIRSWLDATSSSRLLLVRRPRAERSRRTVFVVRSSESAGTVRRIALDALEELADVDLASDGEPFAEPLVLVCGHGTRDACCALRGNAVHAALAPHVSSDALWISSHQGGHRFAANVLVLPSGIQLGRVDPSEAAGVVGDACAGRISLRHYRGRTIFAPHVQAAEAAVREVTGLDGIGDLTVAADDGVRVELRSADGRTFAADVERIEGPVVPASCGAAPEPQTAFTARLA